MHQRLIAFLLCLLLLFPACALAAVTPREIAPLSPDEVPEPSEGMHHYLLLCTDTWDGDPNNLGNTDGVVLVTLDTVQRRVIFCTLTREMLITNVWGYDFYGDDRTLDTHIKLLRRSLGPYSKFIVTLRGVGYRFEVN